MSNYKPKLTEAELKRQVWDYLTYGQNQGKWYFDRLNAGAIYEKRGDRTYGVMLCREGTADFMVIRKWWPQGAPNKWELRLTFLELKGDKGKQSQVQRGFELSVKAQGAEYFVVKSLEDVMEILGEEVKN